MGRRQLGALGAAVVVMLVVSLVGACGGERRARLATTPLPMQPSGLAVGGDVQAHATVAAQVRLTPEQVRQIADACRATTDLPQVGDECAKEVNDKFRRNKGMPCRSKQDACLTAKTVAAPTKPQDDEGSDVAGYIQLTAPECGDNVCLRVGVVEPKVFTEIVEPARHTTVSPESEGPTAPPTPGTSTPGTVTTTSTPSPTEESPTETEEPRPTPVPDESP